MSNDFNPGDKVRVQIDVVGTIDEDGDFQFPESWSSNYVYGADFGREGVTLSDPPVEQFRPGQVVRSRWNDALIALGTDGFITLVGGGISDGISRTYGQHGFRTLEQFTSEEFELVEVAA